MAPLLTRAADPGDLTADDKKLVFQYDYMGRRVEKRVIPWNPNLGTEGDWDVDNPDSVRRFVYYNWLPLLELEVENAGTPSETMTILRKYTWGLDLSQTLDGAGGIGGLLATYDTQGTPETTDDLTYLYVHDANGNVGQVLDWSDDVTSPPSYDWDAARLVAKYEYDAYGNNWLDPTDEQTSGPYADDNPFRFSTKYWDDETGLGYWGQRYYSPRLGRWLSRDPAEDVGGDNLYRFVDNCPTDEVDVLGLWGEKIHRDETRKWAMSKRHGMLEWAADNVGNACNGVDPPTWKWPFHTTASNLSWHFDIPHDATLTWGPSDSRYVHAEEQLSQAIRECSGEYVMFTDVYYALVAVGRGLHPVQDWVAHGTWDPTWKSSLNWRRHPPGSDDFGLDFTLADDGILRDYERDRVLLYSADDPKDIPVEIWREGTNRAILTEQRTLDYLARFKNSLDKCGLCYCKIYIQL